MSAPDDYYDDYDPDPDYHDDDYELVEDECYYCGGTGWCEGEGIAIECPECGGTGYE